MPSFGLFVCWDLNNPAWNSVDWNEFVKMVWFEGHQNKIEIIGNIHENPELLESEDNNA